MASRQDYLNDWAYKSRIWVGQIRELDAATGVATIQCLGQHPNAPDKAQVQMSISMPDIRKTSCSWQRYMPQKLDYVKISYRTDGSAEILGPALYGGVSSQSEDTHAQTYRVLHELRSDSNNIGLADFVPLEQGEWDMRSSGGAYIRGTKTGRLILRSGIAQTSYERDFGEIRSTATLIKQTASSSFIHLGDVKRTIPPAFAATAFPPVPQMPAQEYSVYVADSLTSLPRYEHRAGDVHDALGLGELSSTGIALRSKCVTYDVVGLESYSATIDANGNVLQTLGSSALTYEIVGQTIDYKVTCKNVGLTATVAANMTAPSIELTNTGVPSETTIKADTFLPQLESLVTQLTAAITAASVWSAGASVAVGLLIPPIQVAMVALKTTSKSLVVKVG